MNKVFKKNVSYILLAAFTLLALAGGLSLGINGSGVKAVGETIGYTTDGTLTDGVAANYYNALRYQASTNMTVNQMKIKIATAGTGKMKCAIYSDNAGAIGSFLKGTNELSNLGTGWQTFTLTSSQSLTSGTYYWLVSWRDGSYGIASDSATGVNYYGVLTYAASWPTNLPAYQGTANYRHSFYAIATATSTPVPTSTNTPVPTATNTPVPTATPVGGTIGYSADGAVSDGVAANYYNALRYQASANMTVNQMMIKISVAGTGKMKCAIYSDNAGTIGSFLKGTEEKTNLAVGWQTFNLTTAQSLTSGTYYWLVSWRDGAYSIASDSATAVNYWGACTYAASWPTNLPSSGGQANYRHSFYATSGATPTPGPTNTPTPTTAPTATSTPTPTPVASGTIGYTNDGTQTDGVAANYYNALRYQAASAMTVNQMRIKVSVAGTGNMKCAIYSDNAGNPGNFLIGTVERSNLGTGWQTFTLTSSYTLASGSYYWLVSWRDGNYSIAADPATGANFWGSLTYAASWPTNLPASGGASDFRHSFYAANGATPTPQPTSTPTPPPSGYKVFNKARFYPRSGYAGRMLNGQFQGSNLNQTNGFVTLATISSTPADNAWTDLPFSNSTGYRYIKYYSPTGSYGNVAELEFYENTTKLYGTMFGTAGSQNGNDYTKALDGLTNTFFDASLPDDNYVGFDIANSGSIVANPSFSPAPGSYSSAQNVTISCATSGATIRYTTDGSNPTATYGTVYSGAVNISSTKTLKAIAYKSSMFDSQLTSGTYTIGGGTTTGYVTYHIGNSLTDTINGWLDPICDSAGYNHTYWRSTIPGAGIKWNWDHAGQANGEADYRTVFSTKAPIDHLFLQVFPNPPGINDDAQCSENFYNLANDNSPNIKLWQYMSWPGSDGQSNNYNSASWMSPPWTAPYPTAANFEQAVENTRAYNEALRTRLMSDLGGMNINIVPGAVALKNLKVEIEAGRVSGITDFFGQFTDGLHLNSQASYFIGCVHFACIYQKSPYNIVTYANSGLNQTQANKYQQVAWDSVRNYAYSGCYGM